MTSQSKEELALAVARLQLERATQGAKANAAATQRYWSRIALLLHPLSLAGALGHKQGEEEMGKISETRSRKDWSPAEKRDLEQLATGAIDDQEKEKTFGEAKR